MKTIGRGRKTKHDNKERIEEENKKALRINNKVKKRERLGTVIETSVMKTDRVIQTGRQMRMRLFV